MDGSRTMTLGSLSYHVEAAVELMDASPASGSRAHAVRVRAVRSGAVRWKSELGSSAESEVEVHRLYPTSGVPPVHL